MTFYTISTNLQRGVPYMGHAPSIPGGEGGYSNKFAKRRAPRGRMGGYFNKFAKRRAPYWARPFPPRGRRGGISTNLQRGAPLPVGYLNKFAKRRALSLPGGEGGYFNKFAKRHTPRRRMGGYFNKFAKRRAPYGARPFPPRG